VQDAAAVADPTTAPQQSLLHDDLAAIIDTAADGIVVFDQEGNILSCNRSAEALFNETGEQLVQRNLADLFAPESQAVVLAYFESLDDPGVASLMDHGREVLGQVRGGGLIPLSMTMGRTGGSRYFAVFRDLSQLKKNEADLISARRQVERAAAARSDVLAKISHDIRVPLNAIIGFAEAMLEQRLGPVGSERYLDYMRDIRAAGERVLAIVGDMLDLSRIETGELELTLANVNLNEVVAQCVGALQPQANRERIIIRSSLAHHLPLVVVDAGILQQVVTNLITSSIHLANSGGQVIVSTALTEPGDVALRVRDTGRGLSERDLDAAVAPYRKSAAEQVVPDTASINLSLTKALAEANRAQFHIRKAPQAGTVIEVIFSPAARSAAGPG
jgi:PAS domain S-box-containing protein